MRHIFVMFIILCIVSLPAQAQADKAVIRGAASTADAGIGRDAKKLPVDTIRWKKGGNISVNFSQTSLSNWSAGGEKSLSLSSTSNLYANYKKNKIIWENYAFMTYGIIKSGKNKAIKNSDQLNAGSRVGLQMAKNWYYAAALLEKTQFSPGYKYSATDTIHISDFLAPVNLFLSLGLDYKPSGNMSVSFAPAMGKATLVRSSDPVVLAASGIPQDRIEADKKSRYEFGGGLIFKLAGSFFSKKVTYNSQLELFSNYLKDPQNVDMIWNFQFRIAVTRVVSAAIYLDMMYDDDQKTFANEKQPDGQMKKMQHGAKLQVQNRFDIGLFYAF